MPFIWFGPTGDAISKGADALGGAMETVANTVAEAVADLIESAGNGLQDLLGLAGGIPLLGHALSWMGSVVSGACDWAAVVVKSALDAISGLLAGSLRVIGGALGGDGGLVKRGGLDVASGPSGGILLILAESLSFIQAVIPFVQPLERRLTTEERKRLKKVFRGSLALYNIRLYEGSAGLFSVNARPFTLGNKIYLKERDVSVERSLLVHECVHAWQYQHAGARYAVQALAAQWTLENAYDWEAEVAGGRDAWKRFNREAQAEFIEDLYDQGELVDPGGARMSSGKGVFFDADNDTAFGRFRMGGIDHTDLANLAVQELRSTRSARLSNIWS